MKFKIISFFLLFSFQLFSQNDYEKNDLKKFFEVGGDIFTAPKDFDKNDWINLSLSIGAASGAFFLDEAVRDFSQKNHTEFLDFIFEIDKYYYIPGVGLTTLAVYSYGAADNDKEIKNLGLQLAEASFYSLAAVLIIKTITGRSRPYMEKGNNDFNFIRFNYNNIALPSAHTGLAFSTAAVFANHIDNIYWKIAWYTAASLTGLARIYHDQHWFSDAVLGAFLGYFIGEFVINHSTNNKNNVTNVPLKPNSVITFKIPL